MNTKTVLSESVLHAVNRIQFSDIFEIKEIQELQDLFSDANGVSSIITHPDGTPITKPSKVTRLCYGIIHKTEKGLINCIKSDALLGRQNPDGPLVQPCLSGGLWDAGASISVGGRHIANWLIGQIRNEHIDKHRMMMYADEIGADRKEFMEALNEVPVMSVEQFKKVSKMLFAFANQLSEKAFSNLQLKIQINERKLIEEELLQNEVRLGSLIDLLQNPSDSIQEFLNSALNQLITLTNSKIGYIYFYDEEKKEFTLNSWSKDVMKECMVTEPQTVYCLDKTGLWGEAVRQRKTIVENSFQASNPLKKGYPEGHVELFRYLTVPVFSNEKIVAVVAVANKDSDYTQTDILQVSILMDSLWKVVERKETEEALKKSEDRYRRFISQVSEGVYRLEADEPMDLSLPIEEQVDYIYDHFFIVECNNAFVKMYGDIDENEVLGKGHLDFHGGRYNEVNRGLLRKLITDGFRIDNGITEETNSIGGKIFVSNNSLGIIENNHLVRIWGTQIDITAKVLAERALKESREKYRLLTESIKDVVFIIDVEDWKFLYISPSVKRLRGYTPEEILSEPVSNAGMPEAAEFIFSTTRKRADDFLSGKEPPDKFYMDEIRQPCKDGSIVWTEVVTSFYSNKETGRVEQRGVTRDISERKRTLDEMRKTNILLEQTFEQSPIPMVLVSMPDTVIRIVNPACIDFLGISDEPSLENTSILDLKASWQDFDLDGNPGKLEELPLVRSLMGIKTNGEERIIVRKDGARRNELVYASPIFDDKGVVIAGYIIMMDITIRKQNEEKLRESEEKLNTLFDSMTEMVVLHEVVFDENGKAINYRIIDCNNAFTDITGIKKEDAVGRTATEVYQAETPPYLEEFTSVGISGESFTYTTYYAPMDKHFLISVVSPRKNHFATITNDISTILQVQEVISVKNKELENYLYVASHDLRSPLVNIQGFSQRLQKQTDAIKAILPTNFLDSKTKNDLDVITNGEIPKTLEFINSNVNKMDNLINGLLQISRTGRIRMTISEVDMNLLLKTIITALNFQITEVSAKVSVTDLPNCYGDENQLNQLFSNIIGNALKYRDVTRQLNVEISGRTQYNKVVYTIVDTGIGIAPKHLEKIWDVFYRVDSSARESGDGIGLSLAKRIAEKHNGKIWAESEVGKGSRFYIELQRTKFSE